MASRRHSELNAYSAIRRLDSGLKRAILARDSSSLSADYKRLFKHDMVTAGRGNNLHEIETVNNEKYLVSMPTKFRKNVWIKRGDFVMVEPIAEGDKVRAEIISILYKDQIKYIKQEGLWPKVFDDNSCRDKSGMIPNDMLPPSDDSGDEDLADMVVNANRPRVVYQEEESSSEEEEEEEDGDEHR